jgi:putative transcriptional regulator
MRPKRLLAAFALIVAGVTAAHAQAPAPAPGRLLVANPDMEDPNFAQSVLLILIHQDGGSAAVFLNRPTWVEPAEAFPEIDALERYDGALFLGGPVGAAELLTLIESDGTPPGTALPVGSGIFFSPNPSLLDGIDFSAPAHPKVRVFAGHAEWGPGRLAAEIAAGRWRLLGADSANVFTENPDGLWDKLMLAGDGISASNF